MAYENDYTLGISKGVDIMSEHYKDRYTLEQIKSAWNNALRDSYQKHASVKQTGELFFEYLKLEVKK